MIGVFPFTRLVHVLVIPNPYLVAQDAGRDLELGSQRIRRSWMTPALEAKIADKKDSR